jgi:peptidyl-prolyl cis-trans isomerase C
VKIEESNLKLIPRALASLLIVLLLGGCTTEPVAESRPLIKINGRVIVKAEFDTAFAKTIKTGQSLSAAEREDLERVFLNQLIDQELTSAEVRRRGIVIPPADLAAVLDEHRRDYPSDGFEKMLHERGLTLAEWENELAQSLLLDKLVDQVVGERNRVSDQAIDAYYAEHRADFDRPAQVRARQIVVADRAEGELVLASLRKGEAFTELAKRHSLSPEAERGGDLGFFGRDEMPPEFSAVFALQVGALSPLVKSDYGYHLFLVEAQRPATRLSRQEAEREIRTLLETDRRETLYQEWLQELRGKAAIEVDWRQLKPKQ